MCFYLRGVLCHSAGAQGSNEDGAVYGVGGAFEFPVGGPCPWHSFEAYRPKHPDAGVCYLQHFGSNSRPRGETCQSKQTLPLSTNIQCQ